MLLTPPFRLCICAHVHMCDRSLVYKITHIPADPYVFIADFRGQKMTHTFPPTLAEVMGT